MMTTLAALFCLTLFSFGSAQDQQEPTPEETLAWLQSLDERPDSAQKQPRFPALAVGDLKTLKEVKLGGHRKSDNKHVFIPATEFRFLLGLPALETANLVEIDGLNDESLAFIGRMERLRILNLGDAQVTNAGLKHLAGLKNLESLDLGWTKDVGDAAVPLLAKLPGLKVLGLGGTKITDAGLPGIASIRTLRELKLPATAVTDRGFASLEACPGLEKIALGKKTKVTPAAIDRLKKALPACAVSTQ